MKDLKKTRLENDLAALLINYENNTGSQVLMINVEHNPPIINNGGISRVWVTIRPHTDNTNVHF